MAAWFERDIQRRTLGLFSGLLQREDFRVRTACPAVVALSDDAFLGDHDGPDHRIGAGRSPALRGQAKGERHVPAVEIDLVHRFLRAERPVDRLTEREGLRLACVLALATGVAFLLSCSVRVA